MASSVVIVRHGATEWSKSGQHTSATDLPLLPEGEDGARALAVPLAAGSYDLVLTSPLQRARRTAELAGFADAEVCPDLVEWGYGSAEGRTTAQLREEVPGWSLWTHPTAGAETPAEVGARCDRVLARLDAVDGVALVFAHGHVLRVLTARWLGLAPQDGRLFRLDTSTISELGHERDARVLLRWNNPGATLEQPRSDA